MSTKIAVVILADANQSEDSRGRVFNALALVTDLKSRGGDVVITFQGAGTRWAPKLLQHDHPFHSLYEGVQDKVLGVSCGCADVFGARDDAETAGFALLTENAITGTTGLPPLARLMSEGYEIITF